MKTVWLLVFFISFDLVFASNDDTFVEELFIKSLANGFVQAHFQFSILSNASTLPSSSGQHYNLFPKAVGQIIESYNVREMHLSLTQGLWRHDKWGYPVRSSPPGAELWTWFNDVPGMSVDHSWANLVNSLSGLFCASLNFIDSTNTVIPNLSFRPSGVVKGDKSPDQRFMRYANLPKENVCTENLTPWQKLLPCNSKAGLSTLLNAIKLYNAHYHSLTFDLQPVCRAHPACTSMMVRLTQSVEVVFRPALFSSRPHWSLHSLFGHSLRGACPVATKSLIHVDMSNDSFYKVSVDGGTCCTPCVDLLLIIGLESLGKNVQANRLSCLSVSSYITMYDHHHEESQPGILQIVLEVSDEYTVTPSPTEVTSKGSMKFASYDVVEQTSSGSPLNIQVKWKTKVTYGKTNPPTLHAHRFIAGYGQEKGGITCMMYNNHKTRTVDAVYMEMLPWYVRLYLHTMQLRTDNGTDVEPDLLKFVPGRDRGRPYLLELMFSLPPASVITFSIQFDRAFLKWTEYPPDANIGFYLGSAVISAVLPSSANTTVHILQETLSRHEMTQESEHFMRIYTEPLLLQLPLPDFSMPYNVICLVCTVFAIAFGSIHNLTTRKLDYEKDKDTILMKLKRFIPFLRKESIVKKVKSEADEKKKMAKDNEAGRGNEERTKEESGKVEKVD